MALGIGTDIVRHTRFLEIISRFPHRRARLAQRILHPREMVGFESLSPEKAGARLASAWAAKEALYKCLSRSQQATCRFNEWYKTVVDGHDEMMCEVPTPNERVLVSLSHDGEYTSAFALREKVH